MITLIELFRNSFVFKIFIGILTFASTSLFTTEEIKETKQTEVTFIEISLQEKMMELDNAYFDAYSETIQHEEEVLSSK
tara:strand:- start:4833 stop:5069 length:237 start_codon:yes stop_codon:yes gene_type:complete